MQSNAALYFFVFVLTIAAVVVGYNIQRSRYGRAFDAVRQSPFAAQALGIPVARVKVIAFSLNAAFAGFAGGLLASVVGFIDPPEFGILASIQHITFIVVGGLGSIAGSIVGAVALTALPEALRGVQEYGELIYGFILLGTLLFLPKGLVGLAARLELLRPAKPLAEPPANPHASHLPRSPPMALLEINALSVRFGGVAAVTDVSLAVNSGEIHGIIGPNGAGKTSLINAVTGMVAPHSGSIRFSDREIAGVAPHVISSLGLGRTFQHVELFGDRSVFDNVLTGFYRHQSYGLLAAAFRFGKAGQSERKTREQARALLDAFDLAAYADTRAGLLPFGIQKRVDIARALAAEPKLLLLDEPVSGMSEAEAEAAVTTMRKLAREHGITLVVVEHNMHVLMNLAERVTVLNQGRLLASGTPAEMQANTAVIEAYLGDAA